MDSPGVLSTEDEQFVHTVTVVVRVRSRTPQEARRKIKLLFETAQSRPWPRGCWSIRRVVRGWRP